MRDVTRGVATSRPLRRVPADGQLIGGAPMSRECLRRLAMFAENQDPDALA
jgi:hypothetical protein